MSVLQTKMDKLPVRIKYMHVSDTKEDVWEAYLIINGQIKILHEGKLDELRKWAVENGFEGILL